MKKAILILGPQASGKTTKLKKILSNYKPDKVSILSFNSFSFYSHKELEQVDVVAVEEIYNAKQLEEILQVSAQADCQIIATCQTGIFELTETLLSNFEVIKCNVLKTYSQRSGLGMLWRHLKNVPPGPLFDKVTKVENIF